VTTLTPFEPISNPMIQKFRGQGRLERCAETVNAPIKCPFSLHTLIFHVTEACNLMCRHCWQRSNAENRLRPNDSKPNRPVTPEIFSRILAEGKTLGLTAVKFTGGEPFLHSDIMAFLEIAHGHRLSVLIETNATLLDAVRVTQLSRIHPLFIAVSLDGATGPVHDRFRGCPGAFEKTMAALDSLSGTDIAVQVIMCLHEGNMHDLPAMIRLVFEHGVKSVKINPIQPLGCGGDFVHSKNAPSLVELLRLADVCRDRLAPNFSGEIIFSLPLAFRPFSEIRDHRFSICKIFQILGLLPNGHVSFCGIGNLDADAVIGDIHENSLTDIWHHAPLLCELRERLPKHLKGICSRCIFKSVCLGECRASAFYQTKDLMAPFWICQQAYELGLFPTSRIVP
jgi:AdoMet-dependent heme synthase